MRVDHVKWSVNAGNYIVHIRECHLFSWYLESSFSKWISMWNFIMNVPQTLILFKISSMILATQKYFEGAVIDGPNDCSLQLFLHG